MKSKIVLMAFLLLTMVSGALPQEMYRTSGYFSYGVSPTLNYNIFNADFGSLPGVPSCCPVFNNGNGWGAGFSVLAGYALTDRLSLFVQGGYANLSGELITEEIKKQIYENYLHNVTIEHCIDASLGAARLSAGVEYKFTKKLAGLVKLNLMKFFAYDFTQKESIKSPDWVSFENGLRVRNVVSGELPDINPFYFTFSIGIRYFIPVSRDLFICPELCDDIGLFNFMSSTNWKISTTSVSIMLIYSPDRNHATPIEPADY